MDRRSKHKNIKQGCIMMSGKENNSKAKTKTKRVMKSKSKPKLTDNAKEFLQKNKDFRMVGLCGPVNDDKTEEVLYKLLTLHEARIKQVPRDLTKQERKMFESDPEAEFFVDLVDILQPIDFIINTPGGSALGMFALYDVMKMVQEDCDINTFGLGSVMSAGVLLLAAGTKGNRKIGKNCRVMIHSVQSGTHGASHDIENEVTEIMYTQQQYLAALVKETKMTEKQLDKMMARKMNVYLSAEEAVKFGIADIIV